MVFVVLLWLGDWGFDCFVSLWALSLPYATMLCTFFAAFLAFALHFLAACRFLGDDYLCFVI